MINFNKEPIKGTWPDPEVIKDKSHSSDENTEGLTLEQSRELLIKDLQIVGEKASNKIFELEIDGAPDDELGKATYQKTIAGLRLEIERINGQLEELGAELVKVE